MPRPLRCIPTVLSLDNGDTITNPYDTANTFNNYFGSIAETTKKSIKYTHKHFSHHLSNESDGTIFLKPTDKEEIANTYPLSTLVRPLAQMVYLIEYYFF